MNVQESSTRGRKPRFGKPMTDAERSRRARRRKQIHRETAKAFGLSPVTVLLPDAVVDQMIDLQDGTLDYLPVDLIVMKAMYDYIRSLPEEQKSNPEIVTPSTEEGVAQLIVDALEHAQKMIAEEDL